MTYLTIRVANPGAQRKNFSRRFLVDSGAVFSVIPAAELRALGIAPDKKQGFVLANGQEIEKEVGEARFTGSDGTGFGPD